MLLKDFKKLLSKLNKSTIVKIGSQEPKLTISVDQDNQWYVIIRPDTEVDQISALDDASKMQQMEQEQKQY